MGESASGAVKVAVVHRRGHVVQSQPARLLSKTPSVRDPRPAQRLFTLYLANGASTVSISLLYQQASMPQTSHHHQSGARGKLATQQPPPKHAVARQRRLTGATRSCSVMNVRRPCRYPAGMRCRTSPCPPFWPGAVSGGGVRCASTARRSCEVVWSG